MLIFHELSPSPNSTKLRMALRYKGIEFEAREIDPQNRQPLIELSGQELAPVIEHDGRTLYDSEAILHYLEANWREAPRLYAADRQGRYDSDQFKGDLESRVGMHWFPTFLHSIGRRPFDFRNDFGSRRQASDRFVGGDEFDVFVDKVEPRF